MAWRSARGAETEPTRRRHLGANFAPSSAGRRPDGTRTVGAGRRRALPPGRAVVGGFLVAVAAVVVFAAVLAGTAKPGQRWVVSARPLSAGSVVRSGDLTTSTMRLSADAAGQAFPKGAALDGRTLAVDVPAGALIERSMLVAAGHEPPLRPVGLSVDPASLSGLSAGQRIDILATTGTGTAAAVAVVVRGATLMDMDTSASTLGSTGGAGQVTVGVTSLAEAEAVIQAAHDGTITLLAGEPSDGVGPGADPQGS